MTTIATQNQVISTQLFNDVKLVDVQNTISVDELATKLKGIESISTMLSFLYFADESGSRTKNKAKVLKKLSYKSVFIGHDYASKVNNRLVQDCKDKGMTSDEIAIELKKFEARKANGMTNITNVLYQSDKTKKYAVRGYLGHEKNGNVERTSTEKRLAFIDVETETLISKDDAIKNNMFAPSYFNKPTYTAGRGLLTENHNNFKVQNFLLERIVAIKLGNEMYKVIQ